MSLSQMMAAVQRSQRRGYRPRTYHITTSNVGVYADCERKGYLRDVLGLRSHEPPATNLVMGSAFHTGLEHQSPMRGGAAIRGAHEIPTPFVDEALEERCIVIEEMVRANLEKYGDDWPVRREVPFVLPLLNPASRYPSRLYNFAGVVDGWPNEPDPLLDDVPHPFRNHWTEMLGEWKSAARLSSSYMLALNTKNQSTSYNLATTLALGRPILRTCYRITQKPSIHRRKKNNPETLEGYRDRLRDYYVNRPELLEEVVIERTEEHLMDWANQLWEMTKRRTAMRNESGRYPVMNDKSCVRMEFGTCEYLPLCGRAVGVEAYRIDEDSHPEVTAAVTAASGEEK